MNGGRVKNNLLLIAVFFAVILVYGFYQPRRSDFTPYYAKEEKKLASTKLLFVGDIMLDRNVRNLINAKGFEFFFGGVRELVNSAEVAVGNLEGAFTNNPSLTADLKNKTLQFTFDPSLAPALADLGFDVLGLANNRSLNFGQEGLESTRRQIGRAGMIYYGDPFNHGEVSTIVTKDGISIGLVGFHEFYYVNFDKIFSEIAHLRPLVDVLVVTPHWGPEYEKEPTEKMTGWAHQFIDMGADAVIGTHSHVVGNIETYKNKKIYYSLGNFAFDQYFSKATMNGLTVMMDILKYDGEIEISYSTIPITVGREGVKVGSLE